MYTDRRAIQEIIRIINDNRLLDSLLKLQDRKIKSIESSHNSLRKRIDDIVTRMDGFNNVIEKTVSNSLLNDRFVISIFEDAKKNVLKDIDREFDNKKKVLNSELSKHSNIEMLRSVLNEELTKEKDILKDKYKQDCESFNFNINLVLSVFISIMIGCVVYLIVNSK